MLACLAGFAEAELRNWFRQISETVDKIIRAKPIKDIANTLEEVVNMIFKATTDFSEINHCDALLICVPTPLDRFKKPDMSYIESACVSIGQYMKREVFICLESTTYPSTTETFMLPIIEKESGMKHGKDFWLAFSPERVDPGNTAFHIKNTPKVLGAITPEGLEIGKNIYSKAIEKSTR